jgi:hypothetical protein
MPLFSEMARSSIRLDFIALLFPSSQAFGMMPEQLAIRRCWIVLKCSNDPANDGKAMDQMGYLKKE